MARITRRTAVNQSARDRARAAKAKLDASKAEREQRIEDAAVRWYEAMDLRDEALATATAQDLVMASVVNDLFAEGESLDRVVDLCASSPKEVRRLRKLAGADESTSDDEESSGATPDVTSQDDVEEVRDAS